MLNPLAVKVHEQLSNGSLATIGCIICLFAYSEPKAGHKRDLAIASLYCGCFAVSRFIGAWEALHGRVVGGLMAHELTAIYADLLCFYAFTRVSHFVVTLVRSEYVQRRAIDKPLDEESLAVILPMAARCTREQSESTLGRWQERLAGMQH